MLWVSGFRVKWFVGIPGVEGLRENIVSCNFEKWPSRNMRNTIGFRVYGFRGLRV